MTRATRLMAMLVIGALTLSACGGDDPAEPTPTGESSAAAEATNPTSVTTPGDQSATAVAPGIPTTPGAPSTPAGGAEPGSTAPSTPNPPQSDTPATEAVSEPDAPQVDGGADEESTAEQGSDDVPDAPENPAPPLGSIDSWHNSEPLALEQLRGSPVLLVFWADF